VGAYRLAYWTPLAGGAARLVWAAGPATVDARVSRVAGDAEVLRGTATWTAAGGAPEWRAPIELTRVRCGAR
jgi:hypothetical protein